MFDLESTASEIYNSAENAMADIASCQVAMDNLDTNPTMAWCVEAEVRADELWDDRDTLIDLVGGSVCDAAMENSAGWGTDDFKCVHELILTAIGLKAIDRKHNAMLAAVDYMLARDY